MVPPFVLRMAMIMPTSNPLGLAWEPATSNIPNAAWVLVMLQAPVRPSLGVGPGVAAATSALALPAASVRAVARRYARFLIGGPPWIWTGCRPTSTLRRSYARLGTRCNSPNEQSDLDWIALLSRSRTAVFVRRSGQDTARAAPFYITSCGDAPRSRSFS